MREAPTCDCCDQKFEELTYKVRITKDPTDWRGLPPKICLILEEYDLCRRCYEGLKEYLAKEAKR